jgi:dolichol-phosphate mannosyltransferase
VFGLVHWYQAMLSNSTTPLGTIMFAVLPILIGLQLMLAFLGYDISNVPRRPVHADLPPQRV